MDEIGELLQRQLASEIGRTITIIQKDSTEITGILIEVSNRHVTLKKNTSRKTIFVNRIEGWEILEDEAYSQATLQEDGTAPGKGHGQNNGLENLALATTNNQKIIDNHVGGSTSLTLSSNGHESAIPRAPQHIAEPLHTTKSTRGGTQKAEQFDPPVQTKLIQICAFIEGQILGARIDIAVPDFKPTLNELTNKEHKAAWDSIQQKYTFAKKNNELGTHFGRVQPISQSLKLLVNTVPQSAELRRHLAYIHYLKGERDEALKAYEEATFLSPTPQDWHNLAVLTISDQHEHAGYALMRLFQADPITAQTMAWYTYLGLVRDLGDHLALREVYATQQRMLTADEELYLLDATIYLLHHTDMQEAASRLVKEQLTGTTPHVLFKLIAPYLSDSSQPFYQQQQIRWETQREQFLVQTRPMSLSPKQPQLTATSQTVYSTSSSTSAKNKAPQRVPGPFQKGHVYTYKKTRSYGFINSNGDHHFFHRSAVLDEDLLTQLQNLTSEDKLPARDHISVTFEVEQGPQGTFAVNVSGYYEAQEIFLRALSDADEGEYTRAANRINMVLAVNPDYPEARTLYDKWNEAARETGVPRGSTFYARAKRKQLAEKDLDAAIPLLHEAIKQNDSTNSAVKDLASILMQLNRSEEAIKVLEQYRHLIVNDQQPITNLFIDAYQKAGRYSDAINLLQKTLPQAATNQARANLNWRIAYCHLRLNNYQPAEYFFREVVKLNFNTRAAQRNLAFCLLKQERYDEAERLLQANLPDPQSAELLEAIAKARSTGQSVQITDNPEMLLANLSSEISQFSNFVLERCPYEGVPSLRVQEKRFTREDLRRLEDLATRLGTRRPRERGEYYLSAAKIISENEEWEEDYNLFYRYLCRSFSSRGDAAIIENKHLDTARAWYCEALSAYDGDLGRTRGDEQDAINALTRFLFATQGRTHVPIKEGGRENLGIDDCLEQLLQLPGSNDNVFDAIAYLAGRSQYAAGRVLSRLHTTVTFLGKALHYLKGKGIQLEANVNTISQSQFFGLWNTLQRKNFEKMRSRSLELRSIVRVDLTIASIETSLKQLREEVEASLFFELDKRRSNELQIIFEAMLDLCRQSAFEEKERLCNQIDNRCKDLLRDIETNPTLLSVEDFYPIVQAIEQQIADHLEEIYRSSMPHLTLRLPKGMEYCQPMRRLELQVVIENKMSCSPAESVQLIIQPDPERFTIDKAEIKLNGSLLGGKQHIETIPIQVTDLALQEQAFSLPIYAQYGTRSKQTERTPQVSFSLNFYSAEQFERINNPYSIFASGGIVGDETMFYGRSEIIENISKAIYDARQQSKSIVIFGQKRSGKSSILHHLKKKLEKYDELLVLDLGSMGDLLDPNTTVSLLYQILWSILNTLQLVLEDKIAEGKSALPFILPSDIDFYNHLTPLPFFKDVMVRFKRLTERTPDWQGTRIVLLIDEFSYLYGKIMDGDLSIDFMRNWKALLQNNLFSVVLAGQDMMPKFKMVFPNEFGVTQDERVSYLKTEDAIKLIEVPIHIKGQELGASESKSRYREKAVDSIVNLTAGSPYYIQIICNRLVEYMNRKAIRLVTEANVKDIKDELIHGANLLGWDHFDNLTNSGDTSPDAISEEDAKKVLLAIAINSPTGPCSRSRLDVETKKPLDEILEDLVNREVLEVKAGQYYEIRVGLFKEWLVAHP